jgi:hypothetical protein
LGERRIQRQAVLDGAGQQPFDRPLGRALLA